MDSGWIALLSSALVACLGGFWTWLQAREHRRGEAAGQATKAAFDLNARLESNLKVADERAEKFLNEATELRSRYQEVLAVSHKNEKELAEMRAEFRELKAALELSDSRLSVAMDHITDLRGDILETYTGVTLRPLPDELKGIKR